MILNGYSEFTKDIQLISYKDLEEDVDLKKKYLNWLNDFEVVSPIMSPELMQIKDITFIDKSFERFTKKDAQGFFIKYKPTNIFIGTIKLDKINLVNKSGELGFMIGEKNLWNKKLGSKSALILMKYAFEILKLNKVWGGTDENNIPTQKLFLKLSFKQEGRLRQVNYFNNKYSDNLYYGIIKNEYFKIYEKGRNNEL